jgi:lichenan operon transcriptional antiterminator
MGRPRPLLNKLRPRASTAGGGGGEERMQNRVYGKQRELLIALLRTNNEWTQAKELAVSIDVSVRSVKTYINELNAAQENLVQSSRNGYRADRERVTRLLSEAAAVAGARPPSTQEERLRFIIKRLLTGAGKTLNLLRLCEEELFVSMDTVKKDLAAIRKRLRRFDIYLAASGFTIALEGGELDKRKMLSNILYEEFSESVFSLSAVEKAFPRCDARYVYDTIKDVCKAHRFFVNEYSLLTLLLDIVISVDRITKKRALPEGAGAEPEKEAPDTPEQALVDDLVRRLEERFHIVYNSRERNEIAVIMAGSLIKSGLTM